jgi:hypothetical protein
VGRIRSIKPEFPQSESIGRLSRDARLLFIMLWTIADDSGRLRGNSRMLASLLFPYDDDAKKLIDGWMSELTKESCVDVYQVEGQTYVQICKWLIHQKIDKPTPSKFPAFDESSRALANPRESSTTDRDQGSGIRIKERIKDQELAAKTASRFDDFWNSWPKNERKQDRGKCLDRWKAKGLDAFAESIIADIEKRKLGQKWQDARFIEAPLVYLNNERWNDGFEPDSPPPRTHAFRSNADWQPPELASLSEKTIEGERV